MKVFHLIAMKYAATNRQPFLLLQDLEPNDLGHDREVLQLEVVVILEVGYEPRTGPEVGPEAPDLGQLPAQVIQS